MSRPLYIQNPFVGRKREQQVYQQMLTKTTPWVLIITGQGGIGKSTLLRQLAEITPQDIPVVLLNFANETLRSDRLKILEELSWQLASFCDKRLRTTFEKTLKEGRKQLEDVSKQLTQNVQIGDNASASGIGLDMRGFDAASLRERRLQIQAEVSQALYDQVLTFQPTRLVMMLDTCEWLSEAEGLDTGRWVMDELLPKIHACLAQRRRPCIAVIASRMPPPLSVIERQDRQPFTLPMLEEAAVDLYLEQVGMQDAALRQRVYAITHGHALCVAIIGTLWQEQSDQPLTLDDLPQLQDKFNERALLEFIQERLDKRLVSPFRELTRFGVLLRSFNLPMLQAVFPELFTGVNGASAQDIFQQFIRYPYIESLGNQQRTIHELLREIQAIEIREQQPDEWRTYHKRALDYLTKVMPHPPDWYYHAIAYDEEQGMSDWWDAVETARNRSEREECNALLQAVHDVTLELDQQSSAERSFQEGEYHRAWTDNDTAMESYKVALVLFQQDGLRIGEDNVLRAMGEVQRLRGENEAAMVSYEAALGLYQQEGSRLGEANVRKAMGDVQRFRDENEAAMVSYEAALGLYRQVGSRLGEANCYQAQGDIALEQDNYQEALTLYNRAYQLFQQIQDKYNQARLLFYRSYVYEVMNDLQLAIEDMQQSVAIAQPLNLTFIAIFQERLDDLRSRHPHGQPEPPVE